MENCLNIEELKINVEAGNAEAMCDLGMAYFYGEGIEHNQEKGLGRNLVWVSI